MSHYVICPFCKIRFDRDKESYVSVGSRRYAHSACYKQEQLKDSQLKDLEIIFPDEFVTCKYCKKKINKTKDLDYKAVKKKYAHIACIEAEEKREKTDEEKFYLYVIELFKIEDDFVPPRIQKQAQDYIKKYNYTYSGMLKALKYFYEIKHNDISKSNGGIGILPYCYQDAYNYYFSLWQAQQKNQVDINRYIPREIEITIPIPKRKNTKKKIFTFLDKDEVNEQ